ncbi:NAD(P)/FAD-dependent oxidoreductase [Streptomyces lomondensis]|uniref:D-amino-acid dehydrogenase n=1 Tax=Streptomyces lomondensis TaxID=68229 RepID=A0ABQ2X8S6_9ACTN|nr:FAD-dependent oxidoreductase [Streptomyces lomondensis]MCF0077401.1 FAD-dependent oxidoreductase [Streptomyces lomondensis]GGX04432.1 D-amino-acid dehydrogenase [Streptomyces lomondensis]
MAHSAVIVGAGVIGLATAHRLAEDGLAVTVVDAAPASTGASVHNAGWIVPIMSAPVPAPGMLGQALRWMTRKDSPLYVRPTPRPEHVRFMLRMLRHCNPRDFHHGLEALVTLNERTVHLFDAYEKEGVRFEYHRTGQLMAFRTHEAMRRYQAEAAHLERIGHTAIPLSGDELRDLEPALGPQVRTGLRCPQERHVDPASLVRGLADRCRDLGVRFLYDHPVTGIDSRGATVTSVLAGGERLTGDVFVLAAGVHTGPLARLAGFPLPVQPGKGYGFDDTSGSVTLRHSVYLGEAKVAVTPLSDRLRFAGTMEFGSFDSAVDRHRLRGIARSAHAFLPDFPPALQPRGWTGLRPMTPDGLPVIGPLPGRENLLVASGHCMLGVTLAPMTAELIAGHVAGAPEASALAGPFAPGRFASRRRRP